MRTVQAHTYYLVALLVIITEQNPDMRGVEEVVCAAAHPHCGCTPQQIYLRYTRSNKINTCSYSNSIITMILSLLPQKIREK